MGSGKVVFVEFNRGRGASGTTAARPGFVFVVFLVLALAEVVMAAAFLPSSIGTPLFGPTVVIVAVAGALGVNRVTRRATRLGVRRRPAARGSDSDGPDFHGRTLH